MLNSNTLWRAAGRLSWYTERRCKLNDPAELIHQSLALSASLRVSLAAVRMRATGGVRAAVLPVCLRGLITLPAFSRPIEWARWRRCCFARSSDSGCWWCGGIESFACGLRGQGGGRMLRSQLTFLLGIIWIIINVRVCESVSFHEASRTQHFALHSLGSMFVFSCKLHVLKQLPAHNDLNGMNRVVLYQINVVFPFMPSYHVLKLANVKTGCQQKHSGEMRLREKRTVKFFGQFRDYLLYGTNHDGWQAVTWSD